MKSQKTNKGYFIYMLLITITFTCFFIYDLISNASLIEILFGILMIIVMSAGTIKFYNEWKKK